MDPGIVARLEVDYYIFMLDVEPGLSDPSRRCQILAWTSGRRLIVVLSKSDDPGGLVDIARTLAHTALEDLSCLSVDHVKAVAGRQLGGIFHCHVHCRAWLVISKNVDSSFVVRVARDFKWFSALAFVL